MRLSPDEISSILEELRKVDPNARVFLFGSRADDRAQGGDIDLLVESKCLDFPRKLEVLVAIKEKIGEQKIDLVLSKNLDTETDPFIKSILSQAKQL